MNDNTVFIMNKNIDGRGIASGWTGWTMSRGL